ncbi:hypothetical protein [Streptomyces olivaceiscleroticus]|uniref:Uncharacterized protein n=1 Tax=Streptomyces olivaceiscleroticus TaxID=68245 RepID=A0ABP3JEL5_9ACTN
MHCGTTVGVHGILHRHPWLADADAEELRETVLDLALARADAYGWYAPYGWCTAKGRKARHEPERWLACDQGGDWAGGGEIRELAWMRADIPEDVRHPRLPVLPMARTLLDALDRVGAVALTALCAHLPLQITAGDASGDLDEMREWFALGPPAASLPVSAAASAEAHLTVSAAPSSAWGARHETARVHRAVQERLGGAAEVRIPRTIDAAHLACRETSGELPAGTRPVAQLSVRVREWSADVAMWLIEATGDALRATGHSVPVMVTVSRPSS